jgi:hypothetical protein
MSNEQLYINDPCSEDIDYSNYCVKFFEAWEESGYLLIRSEVCEKGNLNEYLVELINKENTKGAE